MKFDASGKFDADGQSPRTNFDTFLMAFTSIFIVLTGEEWNFIMYDGIRARDFFVALPYFVSLVLIGNFIMLNLFLAILLGNFSNTDEETLDY
mmetsp:Transcript_27141/g.12661  ORF Transcript_27141/g.12661 Transcript_27141/m.12661 type:complete len:93 (-) Transcript_27141:127-405(-)